MQLKPAPVAQWVECPLREVTGSIPGHDISKSLKMIPAAPQTYGVKLGLADPVSG